MTDENSAPKRVGERVKAGETIGFVGNDGTARQPCQEFLSRPRDAPDLDQYGYIRVDGIVVGRVTRNRYGRGFVVNVAGERANHSFGGNSIFATREAAAKARVEEVRGG